MTNLISYVVFTSLPLKMILKRHELKHIEKYLYFIFYKRLGFINKATFLSQSCICLMFFLDRQITGRASEQRDRLELRSPVLRSVQHHRCLL